VSNPAGLLSPAAAFYNILDYRLRIIAYSAGIEGIGQRVAEYIFRAAMRKLRYIRCQQDCGVQVRVWFGLILQWFLTHVRPVFVCWLKITTAFDRL
jgi:hypothetical protein